MRLKIQALFVMMAKPARLYQPCKTFCSPTGHGPTAPHTLSCRQMSVPERNGGSGWFGGVFHWATVRPCPQTLQGEGGMHHLVPRAERCKGSEVTLEVSGIGSTDHLRMFTNQR
ncbi:hypothetical protein DPX16_1293 [Anabarilius grahami]|uniref:Uncharacterized protein n=1 Tax=Anabarilius grahami TaxID=495550 RepID=A0A3N0Y8N2_ANAGA|nr:hypothetical protein DPX16_1293 [Anabarilius grahami]